MRTRPGPRGDMAQERTSWGADEGRLGLQAVPEAVVRLHCEQIRLAIGKACDLRRRGGVPGRHPSSRDGLPLCGITTKTLHSGIRMEKELLAPRGWYEGKQWGTSNSKARET